MNAPNVFLALSVLGVALSGLTYFRIRLHPTQLIPTFLIGWLRGELALQTIAIEAIVTAVWIAIVWSPSSAGRIGLALTLLSWGLLLAVHRRGVNAGGEIAAALASENIVPDRDVSALHGLLRPFAFAHPEVERLRDLAYGDSLPGDQGGRNLLDVVKPKSAGPGDRRPVLLQIHGGGWMIGDKREQGAPLMTHLASRGWVCVASNYRLSPRATMPDHIVDVKRAIAWVRANIESYGGDPDFLCITGGSAGGHLCSLAALTPNDPRFQPGFEHVDTRIEACVPFYGVFDFLDRAGDRGRAKMEPILAERVFKCSPAAAPELWDAVCPISRVTPEAPPFFVIQGSHDSLVFVEEARTFVRALRETSRQPALYAELYGAQHAFEIFHSPRSAHAVRGATAFLERVRAEYEARLAGDGADPVASGREAVRATA